MKKFLLGLSLMVISVLAYSQTNGLEKVIVEKYYIANQEDHDASVAAGDPDPIAVGAVTYRIYVDMLPGYRMQFAYWNENHSLSIQSENLIYNKDGSSFVPNYSRSGLATGTNNLDSWVTMGSGTPVSGTQANWGVLKADDDAANTINFAILNNTDAAMGVPLTSRDGLYMTGATGFPALGPIAPATDIAVGDELKALLGDGSSNGTQFLKGGDGNPLLAGSWYNAGSFIGNNPATYPVGTANRVLIAQITTLGRFQYALNIQVVNNTTNVSEYYVHSNPGLTSTGVAERTIASLTYDSNNVPIAPTVSITSPLNNAGIKTGNLITVSAVAHDANGDATITSVEFFAGATSLGVDVTAPYEVTNWSVPAGATNLTAIATDADGLVTTSTVVVVNGVANPAPAITAFTVTPNPVKVTRSVVISANVTDDASVNSVVFNVGGTNITATGTGPVYSVNWTSVLGVTSVTVTATDNEGAVSTQSTPITVNPNTLPTVSITAPANNAQAFINAPVSLSVLAADLDGTVASVQYYINGTTQGAPVVAPFTLSWTPTAEGSFNITAIATDNDGGVSNVSTSVRVNVVDPNSLPYQVSSVNEKCSESDIFEMPIVALKPVQNVIGFDITMKFNPLKVIPTGVILINSALIDSSLASSTMTVKADSILISVVLNTNAPENTFFTGSGQVCAVQFAKTAAFQASDSARFYVRKLEESKFSGVFPALKIASGLFTSYKDSLLNGSLKFWADNSPMGYELNTNLITTIVGNVNSAIVITPKANGTFEYNINNGQKITINRDINASTPVQIVINGMDGLLTQKVLLEETSFTPNVFQAIAIDVNMDGKISAGDLSQISQRSVRRIVEYKQAWNYTDQGTKIAGKGASRDWLFVSDSTLLYSPAFLVSGTYPANDGIGFSKYKVPVLDTLLALPISDYSTCPVINGQTFRGILLGDVNGSYKSLAPSITLKSASVENGSVIFDMANAIETESTIEVPVYVNSAKVVNALDFTISTSENLEYTGIKEMEKNYSDKSVSGSKLISYFSFGKYSNNKTVAMLHFNKLGQAKSSDINVEIALINGEKAASQVITTKKLVKSDVAVSVFPNPVSSILNVTVSEDATVEFMDMSGRLVSKINVLAGVTNEINVDGFAAGTYLLKVSNDNFVKIEKVIVK